MSAKGCLAGHPSPAKTRWNAPCAARTHNALLQSTTNGKKKCSHLSLIGPKPTKSHARSSHVTNVKTRVQRSSFPSQAKSRRHDAGSRDPQLSPAPRAQNLTLAKSHGTSLLWGGEFERGDLGKTYERFQGAEELRDALEASWTKQFVFSKTSTDGEVPQPQQLDVWMVRVVTLVRKAKRTRQLVGFQ